ncbi:MAG: hypothetical protein H6739_32785 [Alphaproteobacteria bacterium]|nr:hypothetical protein [Alphaproteobacteria bacterium]
MLPSRVPADEDAFLRAAAQESDEAIAEHVRVAVRQGRPQLAGRLVGLLVDEDDDDPELLRARRAARLLCLKPPDPQLFLELDDALERLRRRRVLRAKTRQRERARTEGPLFKDGRTKRRKPRGHEDR